MSDTLWYDILNEIEIKERLITIINNEHKPIELLSNPNYIKIVSVYDWIMKRVMFVLSVLIFTGANLVLVIFFTKLLLFQFNENFVIFIISFPLFVFVMVVFF
jgi:hypothetical protein